VKTWLAAIIAGIVQALVTILTKRSRPTAEDGAEQAELRNRLRREVHRKWSGKKLPVIAFLVVVLALPGCATRTLYVASGEPVRLRETVRSAKVWVLDENGEPTAGVMDLPEGWYCLPVTPEGED
jgi:hypothetical protein